MGLHFPGPYFLFVENEAQLAELNTQLDAYSEIAIDLEAHPLRSYNALTCLM